MLFDVWRPELSDKEKLLIAGMLASINQFGGTADPGAREAPAALLRLEQACQTSMVAWASFGPAPENQVFDITRAN